MLKALKAFAVYAAYLVAVLYFVEWLVRALGDDVFARAVGMWCMLFLCISGWHVLVSRRV